MKIGAMNNPGKDLYKEIRFIADNFDFLDLTLEPGRTYPSIVNVKKILQLKKKYNLEFIGHTPWDLPISSPYASVREAALYEYLKCLSVFSKLSVKLVNVHPSLSESSDAESVIKDNIRFFNRIVKIAKKKDIVIMMENTVSLFNDLGVMARILKETPGLKLHWDVGHANLGNDGERKTRLAFHNFKNKIFHMHFSDNNGKDDQHLPLGAGNINWAMIIKTIKEYKYNKTITLEIHSPDRSYLLLNRDRLRMYWRE